MALHRVAVPIPPARSSAQSAAVPAVAGIPVRQAVLTLEKAGFAVRLIGSALARSTAPVAGDSLARGATVTLYADSLP
ncbi:MAG: PASTA domain-containing protein [Gemmatimonadales bacterium]